MTEKEWLSSGSPNQIHTVCWAGASARRQRLFACACCDRIRHLLPDSQFEAAVRTAERFADGEETAAVLDATFRSVLDASRQLTGTDRLGHRLCGPRACCRATSTDTAHLWETWEEMANLLLDTGSKWHAELQVICELLRCLFGNPFRPVVPDPAWFTSDVNLLARGIYEDKAFDRMPILADALQDAGCDNENVLFHCRDANQVHARGCWVLDLILGKA